MNKNSKQRRKTALKAFNQGNNTSVFQVPVKMKGNGGSDYNLRNVTITIPSRGESKNPARNMQQKVMFNTNEKQQTSSLTVHAPINENEPFRPFTRYKVKTDDRGNVQGLGLNQPWISAQGKVSQVKLA
jgi:hypothetical protein